MPDLPRTPLRGLLRQPALLGTLHHTPSVDAAPSAGRNPGGREPAAPAVMTPGQEQIWLFERLNPGAAAHLVALRARIDGALDPSALRAALTAVVARHAPLRTAFATVDGQPRPVPATESTATLTEQDLRDLPAVRRGVERDRLVADELARPFDLSRGPLLRALLMRLADRESLLLLVVHHIAADGHSLPVLRRELIGRYADLTAGRDVTPPGLAVEYGDIARWQQDLTGTLAADEHRAWWLRTLDRLPAPLDLTASAGSTSGSPGPDRSDDHRGGIVPVVLPATVSHAADRLAQRERASSFMVLLAGFGLLLHRLSGAPDLVVGTPTAGRLRPGTEDVVGHLVNMLPLRLRVEPDPTLRKAVAATRDACLDAYAHQDLPFQEIVSAIGPDRRPGVHPIFQAVFAAPPPVTGTDRVGPTAFTFETVTGPDALYDLEMQLPAVTGERNGYLRYRTARLSRPAAERIAREYVLLMEQMLADPDRHLSNVPRLEPAQRQRIVVDWNVTRSTPDRTRTLVALFEEWADRTPEATALSFDDARLTYRELDERSNRLARHLRRYGVGPEDRVGLCLDRGASWIIGALAVVKLAAGYVPMDPSYPPPRQRYMASDSGTRVVVVDSATRDQWHGALDCEDGGEGGNREDGIQEAAGWSLVDLSRCGAEIAAESAGPLESETAPESLAYVMYTSGSTGRPKGVAVTHRNVIRLVRDVEYVDFRPADTVAQTSNISFDAATFEVWGALLNGARLVGVEKAEMLDPDRLGRRIRDEDVTTMFLTTSLATQVLRERPEVVRPLRHFVFGGEQPNVHAVRTALAHGAPTNLVNGYGPTETTTFAATYRCNELAPTESMVPLGRPITDVRLHVLDGHLEPVDVGAVGELFIGGDGVARGYVGQPGLTADRFIPDHLGGEPGGRLYRTGDLARYRADGSLEFLGRADRQVKIHGFRIEPAEIEDVLDRSGLVRQAAVLPWTDPTGQVRLVGYVVPARPEIDEAAILGHLRDRLPDHLVPARLMSLPALPLTGNGKLDAQALPDPVDQRVGAAPGEPPATPTERALAQIWHEVLKVDGAERTDDFFRLGGHSLNVTQVVVRTSAVIGTEVPLRLLFEHRTLAGFARAVDDLVAAVGTGHQTAGPCLTGTVGPGPTALAGGPGRDVGDLLDTLTAMSDDDVNDLLAGKG